MQALVRQLSSATAYAIALRTGIGRDFNFGGSHESRQVGPLATSLKRRSHIFPVAYLPFQQTRLHQLSPTMSALDANDNSRFANFNILTKIYKTFHGHSISVDILYSKDLDAMPNPTHQPLIIRFHGGGLVSGSSLFPPFFAPWILELAERHSAIIVSPNYRLIPESRVRDTLEDIEDVWAWVHNSLPSILQKETTLLIDFNRIITTGDSAGGYLSIQLGLSHPEQIRAVTASYPVVDLEDPRFSEPLTTPVFGLPPFPKDTLAKHLSSLRAAEMTGSGKVVVSADPNLERAPLMWSIVQHGLFGQFYPRAQRDLHPLLRLE